MVYTSKKRAVFMDAVQNLMCTSKKRGLFLEPGSQIEVHLRHFCLVSVRGRHKAGQATQRRRREQNPKGSRRLLCAIAEH